MDAFSAVLWQKEMEIDALYGQLLHAEGLLADSGAPTPDRNHGCATLALYRLCMAVVDGADWFLKGQMPQAELEERISLVRAEMIRHTSRVGDHALPPTP
jgi:hypothetical protein